MNPSTESLLEETTKLIADSSSPSIITDDYAAQRLRRQTCMADAMRRRTCEGSAAEAQKLMNEELKAEVDKKMKTKKIGSDFALHRLRVMNNHANFRKFSEHRGNIPPDMTEFKRTFSAQPGLSSAAATIDDLSPVSRVTSDKSLPINERSLSGSRSFMQHSSESGNGETPKLLDIRIFFPDSKCVQFTVENGACARANDLLRLVAEHLKIPEHVASSVFALWLTSPLLEVPLKPHHIAAEVRSKWPSFLRKYTYADEAEIVFDEPLLILKRNVSLSIEMEREFVLDCPDVVDMLYVDAKDEYLSGRYLVEVETALDLAALQILIEYGPFDGKDEEYLDLLHVRLSDFVSDQHLSHIRSFQLFGFAIMECKSGLEKEVLQRYKEFSIHYGDQCARKKAYLDLLRHTPFYGAAFFDARIDRRSSSNALLDLGRRVFTAYMPPSKMKVRIGIQSKYITIVDPAKHDTLISQKIDECTWNVPEKMASDFIIHFPDPEYLAKQETSQHALEEGDNLKAPPSRLLQIFSNQTIMMMALLDSMEQIALSEAGSLNEFHYEHPTILSDSDNGCVTSSDEADATVTDSLTSSKKSSQKAPSTISSRSTNTRSSTSSRGSGYSNYKLSKLCTATLDSAGCCIEAHGTLRKLFATTAVH